MHSMNNGSIICSDVVIMTRFCAETAVLIPICCLNKTLSPMVLHIDVILDCSFCCRQLVRVMVFHLVQLCDILCI
jgi:hypothetical protein